MAVQNAGPNGTSQHTASSQPQRSQCTNLHSLPATRGHNLPPVIAATSLTSYINSHYHLTQPRAQSSQLQPQRAMFLSPYSASVLGRAASQMQRQLCERKYGICVPHVSSTSETAPFFFLPFPGFARSSFC